jgi:tRNA(Ile)-lysidine synthase
MIQRHDLCPPGSRLLVALSGGSDSVALLHVLHELAIAGGFAVVGVAHVNHGLRPTASRDEAFCHEVAARLGYACEAARVDVGQRARRDGLSIEEAARRERYASLRVAAARVGATGIATGHTRDDQVETLLMKLGRGAGLSGLGGVFPKRDDLVRPLLEISRAELRSHLRDAGETWVEDETNADLGNIRNRIRHTVVPRLEAALGPSSLDAIARTALLAGEDGRWLDGLGAAAYQRLVVERPDGLAFDRLGLLELPAPLRRRLLLAAMRQKAGIAQIRTDHVDAAGMVAAGLSGAAESPAGRWELSGAAVVLLDSGHPASRAFCYAVPVPGRVQVPEAGGVIAANLETEQIAPECGPLEVSISMSASGTLAVRSRRPGDFLRLRAGRKKLQDLLVDAKVSRAERDRLPVVVDAADRVVWVPGFGVSENFRVDPTKGKVIRLRFMPMEEQA